MTIYIIYKTTNNINGKFYIGKHTIHDNIDDGYLGSGLSLLRAIKKYGRKNFIRETLHIFDNEEACYRKEAELVNEKLVEDINCYNLKGGGFGSSICSMETKKILSEKNKLYRHTDQAKEKISKASTRMWATRSFNERESMKLTGEANPFFGKQHSEATKQIMSNRKLGISRGPLSESTKEKLRGPRGSYGPQQNPPRKENVRYVTRNSCQVI